MLSEGMAQTESNTLARLRLDTSFGRTHDLGWRNENENRVRDHGDGIEGDHTNKFYDFDTPRCGTDEDNSAMNGLHSATPPISVPRHEELPNEDLSYPHKPDDVRASPLESFIQNRSPSFNFDHNASCDSAQQEPLGEPLPKRNTSIRNFQRFQPRSSGLRNALSQEDDEASQPKYPTWGSSPRRYQSQRAFPGSPRAAFPTSPNDDLPANSNSLTSVSTASPIAEELRTPPEGFRGMSSPFCMASPNSLDNRSSWSGSAVTPFGSKPRGLRSNTNRSRRSTTSSGKSPASMFLSMWSSGPEPEPTPQPDDEGQMVGTEYVLGKPIGHGGFSTVKEAYKVEEHGEPRQLAVKIVKKQISDKSERENDEVQAEFDHEVRVWRYLNHPNILTLDAVYETDYATFCFTKYAIGGTLFDSIRQNRNGLETSLAKKYTYQLACALRYLHEDARVVHRDIKLENCLLDPVEGTQTSNLVLCDFGMAEWMATDNGPDSPDPYDDDADRPPPKTIGPAESSTSIAGSLEYASPELLQSSNGVIDPVVDIWAFGVIVFTVVVGSRPFQDAFTPRIQANIIAGKWDQQSVLGGFDDPKTRQDREDALELIKGCLEMNIEKRWTIREILSSRWLDGFSECSSPIPWRL